MLMFSTQISQERIIRVKFHGSILYFFFREDASGPLRK
jgi:hypothetical protein